MHTLCTCLCNKAGHHGICQEEADPACVLDCPELQLYTPGSMCRTCYKAVRSRVDVASRVWGPEPMDVNRPGVPRADSGPPRGGR